MCGISAIGQLAIAQFPGQLQPGQLADPMAMQQLLFM